MSKKLAPLFPILWTVLVAVIVPVLVSCGHKHSVPDRSQEVNVFFQYDESLKPQVSKLNLNSDIVYNSTLAITTFNITVSCGDESFVVTNDSSQGRTYAAACESSLTSLTVADASGKEAVFTSTEKDRAVGKYLTTNAAGVFMVLSGAVNEQASEIKYDYNIFRNSSTLSQPAASQAATGGTKATTVTKAATGTKTTNTTNAVQGGTSTSSSFFIKASSVSGGAKNTCILARDGGVWCTGDNSAGQTGSANLLDTVPVPVHVQDITGALAVASGQSHSCILLGDKTVSCLGGNSHGQLGDGSVQGSRVPTPVVGLTGVTQIAAGQYHSCALLTGGEVRCWGENSDGQLGNASFTASNVPVAVVGVSTAVAVAAAGSNTTCAVLADTTARCWGGNGFGQLGNGSNFRSNVPVTVSGLSGVTAMAPGQNHTCAVFSAPAVLATQTKPATSAITGGVRCWGCQQHTVKQFKPDHANR